MFERDTGIRFEHALPIQKPIEPKLTPFTTIPRLESVNAEEYNSKYEKMLKEKNKPEEPKRESKYEQKFGSGRKDIPTQNSSEPQPVKPESENQPVYQNTRNNASQNKPPVNSSQGSKKKKKNKNKNNRNNKKNNNEIEFYQEYDPNADPFANETYKTEEMLIKESMKKNSDTMGNKLKKSIGKLLSSEEDNGQN